MHYISNLFKGRLSPKYWVRGILFTFVSWLAVIFIGLSVLPEVAANILYIPVIAIYVLFLFSLHVRRWQDKGKGGEHALLLLIPFVGFIVLLYMTTKGDAEANRFGPPPPKKMPFFRAIFNLPSTASQLTTDDPAAEDGPEPLPTPSESVQLQAPAGSKRQTVLVTVMATVVLGFVGIGIVDILEDTATEQVASPEVATYEHLTPIEIVLEADRDEGYKAGYADGRSLEGEYGDNYLPPVTENRQAAYTVGYAEGFVVGCQDGDFDCTEVEAALQEVYDLIDAADSEPAYDVDLIPLSS